MNVKLAVDDRSVQSFLDAAEKQGPFAISLALNWTALDTQREIQRGMERNFVIRQPWVLKQIKFDRGDWASKTKLNATLHIDRRAAFLLKHEEGGTQQRQNMRGTNGLLLPFALPTSALRPTRNTLIDRGMYPKNLGFLPRLDPGGEIIFANRGQPRSRRAHIANRYFWLKPAGQAMDAKGAGIWVRTGSGAGAGKGADRLVMLWQFRSSVTVPATLRMQATAEEVLDERFERHFDRALEEALRTAR